MSLPRMVKIAGLAVALLVATTVVQADEKEAAAPPAAKPRVEVVFVLDTTGSMGGLIEGAKVKIWKIVNQIVSGDPVPDVRVGLVAYRDRGDAYVTQLTPLSADLDRIYSTLRNFQANGGGDTPESVNEALQVAVSKTEWSREPRTLRIVYLVGDAPPHMDYAEDVKYAVTCEAAARAGILVNTIQCGGIDGTREVWQDIARRAEGRYFAIEQSGGMAEVVTPFDRELSELSRKLGGAAVFYGDRDAREKAKDEAADAERRLADAPAEAGAERAGYVAKSGRVAGLDLLGRLESGELKIEDLKDDLLPEDLKKLTADERRAHLTKLLEERKDLRAKMLDLDAKRGEWIKKELEKQGDKGDAFDSTVVESLKEQAAKVGISYK